MKLVVRTLLLVTGILLTTLVSFLSAEEAADQESDE